MTKDEVLAALAAAANESRRKTMLKAGVAPEACYGTLLGPLRKLAQTIGTDHALALELWATHNVDAQLLAVMIFDPAQLSQAAVEQLVADITYVPLLDDLTYRVIAATAVAPTLRQAWCDANDDLRRRAGWALNVAHLGSKQVGAAELEATLARIETELVDATPQAQWTMNHALVQIALCYPAYTDRIIALAERLGVYRDLKVAKGCTSAYAPAWIGAILKKRT